MPLFTNNGLIMVCTDRSLSVWRPNVMTLLSVTTSKRFCWVPIPIWCHTVQDQGQAAEPTTTLIGTRDLLLESKVLKHLDFPVIGSKAHWSKSLLNLGLWTSLLFRSNCQVLVGLLAFILSIVWSDWVTVYDIEDGSINIEPFDLVTVYTHTKYSLINIEPFDRVTVYDIVDGSRESLSPNNL